MGVWYLHIFSKRPISLLSITKVKRVAIVIQHLRQLCTYTRCLSHPFLSPQQANFSHSRNLESLSLVGKRNVKKILQANFTFFHYDYSYFCYNIDSGRTREEAPVSPCFLFSFHFFFSFLKNLQTLPVTSQPSTQRGTQPVTVVSMPPVSGQEIEPHFCSLKYVSFILFFLKKKIKTPKQYTIVLGLPASHTESFFTTMNAATSCNRSCSHRIALLHDPQPGHRLPPSQVTASCRLPPAQRLCLRICP